MNGGRGVALMPFPFFRQGDRVWDNGVGENNQGRRINQVGQSNSIRRTVCALLRIGNDVSFMVERVTL